MFSQTISSRTGSAAGQYVRANFAVVRGEQRVLAWHSRLLTLTERCGQQDAATFLPHFLSAGRAASKLPCLLVALNRAGELDAAVLLHEYGPLGLASGIFTPIDFAGQRDILAPEPLRAAYARQAAKYLIERGARLVLIALQDPGLSLLPLVPLTVPAKIASLTSDTARTLRLESTFEATLAALGAHTRRNLRHFRRQAESKLGALYVPEAHLSEAQYLEFNRHSLYPARASVARWRFRSARNLPGAFFSGVQAADGHWLSLIGGRRHQHTTYLDWQLNSEELPAFSLGTVTRSFLIEYEIAHGAKSLTFEGGTPHSISHSFLPESVTHLLFTRPPLSLPICRKVLARILPNGNLLAKTLRDQNLFWHH